MSATNLEPNNVHRIGVEADARADASRVNRFLPSDRLLWRVGVATRITTGNDYLSG